MTWLGERQVGAVHIHPRGIGWLVATGSGDTLQVRDGGVRPADSTELPPALDRIAPLLARRGVAWSVLLPLEVRAAVTRLPPLGPKEMAQGAHWEAEKAFRLADRDPCYDYELMPGSTGTATELPALLVAARRSAVREWQEWLGTLRHRCRRLEPASTAVARAFHHFSRQQESDRRAIVYAERDAGGAVIGIFQEGRPLSVRSLPQPATPGAAPLAGEEGLRAFRETLLYCEDRHPRLELSGLVAFGEWEDGWLARAEAASGLPRLGQPAAPEGTPVELRHVDAWLPLFGGVLGFAPCT